MLGSELAQSRQSTILFGCTAAIYLLAFPYHPKLRSPNELSRLWEARAIVDHGTLELGRTLAEHGRVGDLSVVEGRYYPSKAPLLSFLAVPVVAALELAQRLRGLPPQAFGELALVFWSRLFLTVLPALAMLVWLRRFLRAYFDAGLADALVATYALGTMALSFAQMFISHQLTAVLLFCSFYSLWRHRRGEWAPWAEGMAGAFAGAALACEYTAAIGVFGLMIYGAASAKAPRAILGTAARMTAGALPFVLGLMAYHWACFGHPLETGYRHLNDAAYQPWHLGGFLGVKIPDRHALLLSLFSPLRGLFVLSPFLLLAPAGLGAIRSRLQDRALFLSTAAISALYLYFTASFSYDSWGWTPGPRHLTPWLPFLMLPVGLAIQRLLEAAETSIGARIVAGAAVALCGLSIALTITVAQVNYIPDDVSTSLFSLALPLMRDGYWVPNGLLLLGLPGQFGAILLLAIAAIAAAIVIRLLMPRSLGRAAWAGALIAAGLHLGWLLMATRGDTADRRALSFLKASWLTPPGRAPLLGE